MVSCGSTCCVPIEIACGHIPAEFPQQSFGQGRLTALSWTCKRYHLSAKVFEDYRFQLPCFFDHFYPYSKILATILRSGIINSGDNHNNYWLGNGNKGQPDPATLPVTGDLKRIPTFTHQAKRRGISGEI